MSTLAFTAQGDTFDVPDTVCAWRVRRLRPRGAPELVYGRDGLPLTVPIECDIAMLRDAVGGVLGRYRLDPLDEHGKVIEDVPTAYVQVVLPDPETLPAASPPATGPYAVVQESMRLNMELAKTMVDRFPDMLRASAELLRAADAAGLPRRRAHVHHIGDATPRKRSDALSSLLAPLVNVCASAFTSALPATAADEPDPGPSN
jgi:hypothetical protein